MGTVAAAVIIALKRLDTKDRGWLGQCVALLQAGQPIEVLAHGRQARRVERAVVLGKDYRLNFFSLWLMPRLTVVLEAAAQGHYRVSTKRIDETRVAISF